MGKGLSLKLCMGYGAGAVGEAGFYQFVTSFQLIFLTGVVGMPPGMAGTITSLTILVEAICSIVVGRFSDQLTWRYGRRRPFVLVAAVTVPITVVLGFTAIHQSMTVMFIYYTVVGALGWVAYASFYIPYAAFGAEIARGYNERIQLRTYSRVYNIGATYMATSLPLTLIALFTSRGISAERSWFYFAILFGGITAVALLFCWRATKGTEVIEPEAGQGKKEPMWLVFHDFWQLIRIKSMAILIGAKMIFMVAFTFYTSGMMFYMQYRLGLATEQISVIYLITVVLSAIYTPFIAKAAMKFGKQQEVVGAIGLSGVGGLILYFVGIDTYAMAIFYIVLFMFVQSSYWQISNAIFYDITEVDEYRYGKRREGNIAAMQSIAGTLAASLGLQLIGLFLKSAGFDSSLAQQSERAMAELSRIFVLYPSAALLVSGVLLCAYPITRKRFEMLFNAIELRKRGEDYSMYREELDRL